MQVLLAIVVAIAIALALLWWNQRTLVYFPSSQRPPAAATLLRSAEDVTLTTADGLELGAYFVRPDGPARATVLVCNGNAGDRSDRAPLAAALAREGFAVLLFDYRGYGRNAGSPSEAGLLEDARAARAYLGTRSDVNVTRIVYFGESLGAAVATALAADVPPRALVLRSPFGSLAAVGRNHYPYLPVIAPLLFDRFEVAERVAGLSVPVFVVAGERDAIVPLPLSRDVYDRAREPKRWLVVPGADHNDRVLLDGAEILAAVREAAGP